MAPRSIHLRSRGQPIGPLPLRSVEILYVSRILADSTPVSVDAGDFRPIAAWPELKARLDEVRRSVLQGLDPWADGDPEDGGGGDDTDDTGHQWDLINSPPIRVLFECAAGERTGLLSFESEQARVELSLLDGRIVAVWTEAPELSLPSFLIERGAVPQRAVEQAVIRAPSVGGDLGAALISGGAIAPHVYLEKLAEWARSVVSTVALWDAGQAVLVRRAVDAPAVPLGIDRLSILYEAIKGMPRERLDTELGSYGERPLIPSSVEGLSLDELKLPPRELRVLKAVDGVKTLGQLVGSGEQATAAMRAIYLALSIGMIVAGDDRRYQDEMEEAKRLEARLALLERKSPLEILGVKYGDSDEQVRDRYMTLAKELHPDRARSDAAPQLLLVRGKLFALVQGAYEACDTLPKRDSLRKVSEQGLDAGKSEQDLVREVLEAEADFKKAEVLAKVKRYDEALATIEEALKKKPNDTEFKVHRAYYRCLARKGTPEAAGQAISEIGGLMKGGEELVSAYLFLARLHKMVSKEEIALKYFKKVQQFDPRNTEAASEIRLSNMRKEKEKKKKWL